MEVVKTVALEDMIWSGAVVNFDLLTNDEKGEVEEALEDYYSQIGETPTETEVNDLIWFDFEFVCGLAGITYNEDEHEIVRG